MRLTFEQFVDLGERMRRAQNAYFDKRDVRDLARSKELEREFDQAVADYHQQGLFDAFRSP